MKDALTELIFNPQTVFFGLFLFLFFYTLSDSRERESEMRKALDDAGEINLKSLDTIRHLTSKLDIVDEIKEDVKELKVLHKNQKY